MATCGTFQKLRPLSLLIHLSSCYDSAHLKVSSNSVTWSIYLEQGKVTYAYHSVDPLDRLDCHLRRLSHNIPTLTSEIRAQLRLLFETDAQNHSIQTPDYQAICWLINNKYLNNIQAAALIEGLVKEVIEPFLLVKEGTYELREKPRILHDFCKLELQPIVEHCQERLKGWQALAPQIWSTYQRPYLSNQNTTEQQLLPEEVKQQLSAILKGFSFRHLAILLNQDELQLAQSLHQYAVAGIILLDDPQPPFEQLPRTFNQVPENNNSFSESVGKLAAPVSTMITDNTDALDKAPFNSQLPTISHPISAESRTELTSIISNPNSNDTATRLGGLLGSRASKNNYRIVSVDDSPTILKEISHFLDDESFSVFTINDSIKALMQIVRLKPDLILLDIDMPGLNGYELCRLLRNHPLFKRTPIIMVTGHTGVIDRVKARFTGASGYLTKPFRQSDLLKIVFRHLY